MTRKSGLICTFFCFCIGLAIVATPALARAAGQNLPGKGSGQSISGQVQSGINPVAGATVMLYATGNTYATGATALGGAASDSSGAFTINFSCPAGNPLLYLVASGGNTGAGANGAIGLMAVLARCRTLKSTATALVNELTTVAAEWALAQFTDATGQIIGAPQSNAAGLTNAARQANRDLVDFASGNPAAFLPTASQCGASPASVNCDGLERINTVANILAACVESSGPLSYGCSTLFDNTNTPAGGTTLQAAHAIVTNPTVNVGILYSLDASPAPYSPSLTTAPSDWTLALNFAPTGAQFNLVGFPAFDATGNLWVDNRSGGAGCATLSTPCGSVSELTAASGYSMGLNFAAAGAAFDFPITTVVDTAGNVFVGNFQGGSGCGSLVSPQPPCGSVSELTAASGYSTGLNFAPAAAQFDVVDWITLDSAGNVWGVNEEGGAGCTSSTSPCGSVSELTAASGYTTGLNFAPSGAMFNLAFTLAVDSLSNVWVVNLTYPGSLSELPSASGYTIGYNFAPAGAELLLPVLSTLDNAGNVWVTNFFGGVSELTAASGYAVGFNFNPAGAQFNTTHGIALDSDQNVWVTNKAGGAGCNRNQTLSTTPCGSLSELTAASSYVEGLNFAPPGAGFANAAGVAVDGAGNVWVSNLAGGAGCPSASPCGSISEFFGLAKPVLAPTPACLQKGHNVCLP